MFCSFCGKTLADNARFCPSCGRAVPEASEAPAAPAAEPAPAPLFEGVAAPRYAGFWLRFLAYLIDYVIVLVPLLGFFLVLGVFLGIASGGRGFDEKEIEKVFRVLGYIMGIPAYWLYYAWMESSAAQATLGKKALGLKVTDLEGQRVSFGRATGRHFAKIISGLFVGIGFLMIAFTAKKQGLHDMMADCLVVRRT